MDYYSDYERFLRETADEVGNLVSYKENLRRFRQQARLFVKQYETHCDAVKQRDEKASTDPRLRDYSKGPPGPGWRWVSTLELSSGKTSGHWEPSDDQLPPDPFKWFSGPPVVIGASHEAKQPCCKKIELPCKEILLPCCYVLLITVHDNMCPHGFPLISEGIWSQEEGDSWYDETIGGALRHAVFRDIYGNYKLRFRRKIEWSLEKVKADLPKKPAEKGENNTPAKRESWRWKLYEKTLKVIVEAVLGLLGPKG